jgi:ABC-type Fe3+ transport system permease subunit
MTTMAVPIFDTIAYYATPPNSYTGAIIFLSYIVLALYATLSIIYSLYTQYSSIFSIPTKDEKVKAARAARAQHIKIYAFLASVSFATLSYHMLFFLITHYLNWSGDKSGSWSAVSIQKLQTWMLESTLFQDFATELVQSVPNAVWTQLAILATWFWNIWMARKGNLIVSFTVPRAH